MCKAFGATGALNAPMADPIAMQLFQEPTAPLSPRAKLLSLAEGMRGIDLRPSVMATPRKSGPGGEPFFRHRRRHTLSGFKRSGSQPPPESLAMSFKPLPRGKAATTEDAVLGRRRSCAVVIAVKPASSVSSSSSNCDNATTESTGSLEEQSEVLSRSVRREKLQEFADYLLSLDQRTMMRRTGPYMRQINPYDFRSGSFFEPKFTGTEGKHDIDLGVMKSKGKRVAAMEPEEFAKALRKMFLQNGTNKDVVVIAVSQKYTQVFERAMGLDYHGPSLEGGVSVVMELLGDVRSGAWSFASSLWG